MYKALKSFSGVISMRKGEVKDIQDDFIVADLKRAGYIEDYVEEKPEEIKPKYVEKEIPTGAKNAPVKKSTKKKK
jgi:hypothetical protein